MKNEILHGFRFFSRILVKISGNFANCPYFSSNSHIIYEKIEKFRQIFIKIEPKKLYFSFGE